MNKRTLLGLIVFACLVTTGLFAGANYFIRQADTSIDNTDTKESLEASDKQQSPTKALEEVVVPASDTQEVNTANNTQDIASAEDAFTQEPWLLSNPSDTGISLESKLEVEPTNALTASTDAATEVAAGDEETIKSSSLTEETSIEESLVPQLILDSSEVDYQSFIPKMVIDNDLAEALDISNPNIEVDAKAAILFDAETKEVLYYKDAVETVFPASTAKLLTSVVALRWCEPDEEITVGDEITMMASDSTRAYLREGQVLTVQNMLAGMLLPSGNDAAYAMAAYVGRKSLQNPEATKEEAISEFIRLMNHEAAILGAKNSCFKTPDGYDAIGQYTTAYDMGRIGIAAANNETIVAVTKQSCSRNIFCSGEDVTWNSTNKLIKKYSGQYYSNSIGLKTGTSTMAGRCIVAAAEKDGKKVVCAIMDSSSAGRWEDAIKLLSYGLK